MAHVCQRERQEPHRQSSSLVALFVLLHLSPGSIDVCPPPQPPLSRCLPISCVCAAGLVKAWQNHGGGEAAVTGCDGRVMPTVG